MAPKPKPNFWEDPTFQNLFGSYMDQGISDRTAAKSKLDIARTNIFGPGGQLAQTDLASKEAQNRIAEEAAYRGGLSSGAYNTTATKSAADYSNQKLGLQQQYADMTNADTLLQQGLKLNADGSVSPLAEGEQINWNGQLVPYSWALHTNAGRQAKQQALAQYLQYITPTNVGK